MSGSIDWPGLLVQLGIDGAVVAKQELSGGCIHRVLQLTLSGGESIVAKVNHVRHRGLFDEEIAGLNALAATGTVRVPRPIGVVADDAVVAILMEHLPPGTDRGESWRRFGADLARLHRVAAGARYGFDIDNHLGRTPQPNRWTDDWVVFNQEQRLGHQLKLARDAGLLDRSEAQRISGLIDSLDRALPTKPTPALLHGDLWSGNAILTTGNGGRTEVAVIDPATSVGDGWADIAMMQLFGGFPPATYKAYAEQIDPPDAVDRRIAVYQLYHVLNHVNLFGRSYLGQAMAMVATLE